MLFMQFLISLFSYVCQVQRLRDTCIMKYIRDTVYDTLDAFMRNFVIKYTRSAFEKTYCPLNVLKHTLYHLDRLLFIA